MRILYHMPLDPACRTVRIALAEKGLPAVLEVTPPWENDSRLTAANPAGTVPALRDSGADATSWISPVSAIVEYLDETYQEPALLSGKAAERAEIRRIAAWFFNKFDTEVIAFIVRERIDKRLMRKGQPDYDLLRSGIEALDWHLDYFSWLLDSRTWFAGEAYSAADIAAAASLSSLDYVDALSWDKFPVVKEWYARVKSRPAFRPILRDRVEGLPPPRHYSDLDF